MKPLLSISVSGLLLALGWVWALFYVGADTDQGNVYRIIYVHVPSAWNAFLWVIMGGVFAARALFQREKIKQLDRSAHAAIRVGSVFSFLALATGSIWGRPTWGVWWDWDPRLTSTLVMFLVCCGYLILRSLTPDINQRRSMSSIVAILASVNVPLVYYSVNIWRSVHQPQTFTKSESNASGDVKYLLLYNTISMTFFAFSLYKIVRASISSQEQLAALRER